MPLQPIPPDPEPTEAELADFLGRYRPVEGAPVVPGMTHADLCRDTAGLDWKVWKRSQNPDAFLVPYQSDVFERAADYEAYLGSDEWLAIRAEELEAALGRCRCCGRRATRVHHRDYRPRVLRGEDRNALVAICDPCHRHIHKVRGKKATAHWHECEERLAVLVSIYERAQ